MMVLPLTTVMDTFDTQVAEITVLVQPGQETQTVVQLAQDALGAGDYRTDTLEKALTDSSAQKVLIDHHLNPARNEFTPSARIPP